MQSLQKAERLISEQNPVEPNPPLQLPFKPSRSPPYPQHTNNNFHTVHTACVRLHMNNGRHKQICTFLNLLLSAYHNQLHSYILPPSTTVRIQPGNTQRYPLLHIPTKLTHTLHAPHNHTQPNITRQSRKNTHPIFHSHTHTHTHKLLYDKKTQHLTFISLCCKQTALAALFRLVLLKMGIMMPETC
jgi:hypothetical protein